MKYIGRVEKRKLCDTARQFFVWQGSEDAVVAELRQVFAGEYASGIFAGIMSKSEGFPDCRQTEKWPL